MNSFKKFFNTTFRVFKIYRKIAPWVTIGIVITELINSLQSLVYSYIFAVLLDKLIFLASTKSATIQEFLPLVFIYAAINLAFSLVGVLHSYLNNYLGNLDHAKLRLMEADHMMALGVAQMENPEITNKATRFNEIYGALNAHLILLITLTAAIFTAIANGAIVFSFAPILVVATIIFFLFKYTTNSHYINALWTLRLSTTEERRRAGASMGYLTHPSSLSELILSSGGSIVRKKFADYTDWYFQQVIKIRGRWAIYEAFQAILDTILFGIGIMVVVQNGISGAISVGLITFYIRALSSFSGNLGSLSYRIARARESGINIDDALDFLDHYKPDIDGNLVLPKTTKPPAIELSNISFSYPTGNQKVIDEISLKIQPGEKIAIVGENGAGKTTLVKLLSRIYKPTQGEIYINSKDLNKIKIKTWYRSLGVLFQDFNSYQSLTVAENVKIGRPKTKDPGNKKVISALKHANAFSFVEKYPNGLDQILSERYKGGIRPSGGQWQKIAIARFFYRNAPVLIFDEPTAAIDAVSEAQIFDNIYKFMQGKTVIIISHRFSTVRNADRIIVLDKGKIIEEGSHEELLKLEGKYAHAFKLQAKGYN
jgi:ATP-binding cassette, subfamily B, bacterial